MLIHHLYKKFILGMFWVQTWDKLLPGKLHWVLEYQTMLSAQPLTKFVHLEWRVGLNSLFVLTINWSIWSSLIHANSLFTATMIAAQSIQLGINDVVVSGGMESMSNAPKYLVDARFVSFILHIFASRLYLPGRCYVES